MHLVKKLLSVVGVLCACFAFSGQVMAEEPLKFSKGEVETIIAQAKDHLLKVGKDQALKDFMDATNTQFRKGSFYVFAFDYKGLCLAHIKPAMVGSNMMEIKDPNGFPIIKSMAELSKKDPKGGWIEYLWQNPTTNKVEKKYSYALPVNDEIFIGAGFYESEKK
jgi:cytochrome c